MITGIGVDMIEVERVLRAIRKEAFLTRYFTGPERELIAGDNKKAADNFAVKEAVAKMLGTGFRKITPAEIEVLRNELGSPYVRLLGEAKKAGVGMELKKIHVSITNTKEYAVAFVVGEK